MYRRRLYKLAAKQLPTWGGYSPPRTQPMQNLRAIPSAEVEPPHLADADPPHAAHCTKLTVRLKR
eukprot:1183240-Prorocentrum_minimum.AAC.1